MQLVSALFLLLLQWWAYTPGSAVLLLLLHCSLDFKLVAGLCARNCCIDAVWCSGLAKIFMQQ